MTRSMTKTRSSRRNRFLAFAAGSCALLPMMASAQTVRIENAWKSAQHIHIENGFPEATQAAPGWHSARWVLERVEGTNTFRIKNLWKGTYLNVETGKLDSTPIQPGWLSARWRLVPKASGWRIENAWTNAALHVENGMLEAGPAADGWLSARWKLNANLDGAKHREIVMSNGDLYLEIDATAEQRDRDAAAAAPAPKAPADCNNINETGACLDENIGQPTRDFFEKTVADPFRPGGAVASAFGVDPKWYRANIDFCHSDLTDEETTDNITVDFYAADGFIERKQVAGNASDCGVFSKGTLEVSITTPRTVSEVRVSTDGGNAMFIDQVRVYRGNDIYLWDGRDNGRGWCLSRDPQDYVGGWENQAGTCSSSFTFKSKAN